MTPGCQTEGSRDTVVCQNFLEQEEPKEILMDEFDHQVLGGQEDYQEKDNLSQNPNYFHSQNVPLETQLAGNMEHLEDLDRDQLKDMPHEDKLGKQQQLDK